ncbi:MAG: shikimate dehydrogenase family protein [Candidatus Zixiibacteriota bacterium]
MSSIYNFALIGHQISYSLSAAVFKAIFDVEKIKGKYEVFDIAPPNFHGEFIQLVKKGIRGLSVTIPYKRMVIQHLHDVDTVARSLDAVNSISNDAGRLLGFNTDCYGFSLPLRKQAERLKHGSALIFGCGGAAKAAVYSLFTDYEVRKFTIVGRTDERLSEFKLSLKQQIPHIDITAVNIKDLQRRPRRRKRYEIIVNCTPLGGWNYPDETPMPDSFEWSQGRIYYDVNYNADNKIVLEAVQAGLTAIDGSAMLVGQAIRSFAIWTGDSVPFEPVYQRVFGKG